jgi:DMSO/TMAO reductase YedYZ molybdopterin-dependent catalytic subunit
VGQHSRAWHPGGMQTSGEGWAAPRGALVAGLVAGTVTVSVAELLAAFGQRIGAAGGTPSPVLALGAAFIDRTPAWLKEAAISAFGTHDKQALLVGIAIVVALLGAAAGRLAAWDVRAGSVVVLVLAAVALAAVLSRPHAALADALPTIVAAGVGLWVLAALMGRWRRLTLGKNPAQAVARRTFLRVLGVAAGSAATGGALASALARGQQAVQAGRQALLLPQPTSPGPSAAQTVSLDVAGVSSLLTAPTEFYRIDTALVVPQVDPGQWRLRVHGLVEQEVTITFAELLALPMIERMVTLSCVSNEVGGDLVGNQRWLGHPLRTILARAKPLAEADMVLSTSADGWTAGTPLSALTDPNRDALLAVGMGGQPLPVEHGFPARLVVPGLYGYVSATKWVVDLEVTRFDRAQGYWTPRGWSALGPIKTQSRIDVPRAGAQVDVGPGVIAMRDRGSRPGSATAAPPTPGGSGCCRGRRLRAITDCRCGPLTPPVPRKPQTWPMWHPTVPPVGILWMFR